MPPQRLMKLDPAYLQGLIKMQGATWRPAITKFSELTHEEKVQRLGYVPGPTEESLESRELVARGKIGAQRAWKEAGIALPPLTYPVSFDWRNVAGTNYVSPVRDQGSCGSCVAFGTIATVEGTERVRCNNPSAQLDYSEADLFYCVAGSQGRNCGNGWWVESALDALKNRGVVDEAWFPYTTANTSCSLAAGWQTRRTKIQGWHSINSQPQMKAWIAAKGPLSTCFTVYNDFFSYSGGVYRHVTGDVAGGHCVSCVGYDDAGQFWVCKNSWGEGFGEGGYFSIAYGDCGIDSTMWAVDAYPFIYFPPQSLTGPIYRYWNGDASDHFYTTNWTELGGGASGWGFERIQGYCYFQPQAQPGIVPLYRYWNGDIGDHFYTTDWNELGPGKNGWGYEGIQGYVCPVEGPGAVPLYRYWNGDIGDHFYTTDWNELGNGNHGWHFEKVQCYILAQPVNAIPVSIPATLRTNPTEPLSVSIADSFRLNAGNSGVNIPETFRLRSSGKMSGKSTGLYKP
jgi:C1A family cysteine protease